MKPVVVFVGFGPSGWFERRFSLGEWGRHGAIVRRLCVPVLLYLDGDLA